VTLSPGFSTRVATLSAVIALSFASTTLGVLVPIRSAAAAQPDAKTDPKRRADAAVKEGLELAKGGKTEAALAKFEEAYALVPTGASVYHMARMEQTLGRTGSALGHYRDALQDGSLAADLRRDAERSVEELKAKMSVLTLDVPPGSTTSVDGNEVDPKNPIEVVPGKHVVVIRLGGDTKTTEVTTRAGAVQPVKLRFGEEAGTATATPPSTGGPPPEPARPADDATGWTTPRIVTVGALGAGAAALAVLSFVFRGNAEDAVDDAKATLGGRGCVGVASAECTRAAELKDDRDASVTASTVSIVGAGVLAAGAVAAAIFWPTGKGRGEVRVAPAVGSGYGGMSLIGRF
jgi:hypothetical protein